MDCIHYKVREYGRILSRTAYIVPGVTLDVYKDIISIIVGANETSKFWLGMLNDLKNCGVQGVLFFCVDGLHSFIGGLNRQYRKVTKTKSVFPSDVSLEKMLYLASGNVIKKWTQRYRGWDQVLKQLIVLYGERLNPYL